MPRPTAAASKSLIAIVVSRYNATVTDRLLAGAVDAHRERSGGALTIIDAPGSYELPALALAAAGRGAAAVVALGCLIKGETSHDRIIAEAVAQGLMGVTLATGVPVTFGVLTVDTAKQALARAGGADGNKGADAMNAALDVLEAIAEMNGVSASGAPRAARHDKLRKAERRTSPKQQRPRAGKRAKA